MQNFTLGKRGLPMLLFALTLLTTSFSSFGQENCPTVTRDDDAGEPGFQQSFCYLNRVSDLEATANGDTVRWYRTATSTTPIPQDELLQDGSYYAGNASGTCTNRVLVSVSVDDAGAPEPQFGNIFAPCVYGTTVTDAKTVQDLIANIDGNDVEIYEEQFTGNPLPPSTPLEIGENYFAGQRNEVTDCPTSRVAVRYDPIFAPAPTAEPVQTFCEGATVANLEAQGTSQYTQGFRWYSTSTSQPPLASSTELIDGETYYVSQIVNRDDRNEPPCESRDRFEVTVDIQQPVDLGTPSEGIICDSDVQDTFPSIDSIRNFYLGLLPAGTPTDGTFNPTPAELAQAYQNDEDGLGSFMTVYTVGIDGCESSVELTATIVADEEANAGTIEDILVECGNEDIIILDDSILSDDATTGGTFTGEGLNAEGNFDPAIGPGNYEITYSVDDSADCVIDGTSDSTTFNITVEGSELGEPIVMEMCITEAQALLASPADAEAFFNNILAENGITDFGGSFNPSEDIVGSEIFAYINSSPTAPQTFETTYSISNSCGDDSVLISLTINNTTAPDAGEINPAPVCASTTPFDLNSLLGDNNDQGGIFSNANGVIENGLFDVSEMGTFPITYTVSESAENCTAGDDDFTEFTLTVNEGIVAESPENAIVCETDVQELFPSNDEIRKFYVAIAQQAGFPTNGTLNPNAAQLAQMYQNDADGLGEFTTTYTFGEGDCQTSVDLTVEIVPATDANAGSIEDVTVDCDNEESIVLASLTNEGGNTGGTFSGEGVTNGSFDPSVGPGTYTITYSVDDTADCVTPGTSAETTFTITVQSTFDLGEPIALEMCITEVQAMVANPQLAIDLFNDAIAERTNGDLSGEFTPSIQTLAGQIVTYLGNPTPSQTFETTYSVSTDCGDDSVLVSLTINDVTEATTGDIADFQVCGGDSPINLFDFLTDANTMGGTFSTEDGEIVNGLFDVSQMGDYTVTYTVSEDQGEACVEGTASTQFTVTVTDGEEATLEPIANSNVCLSEDGFDLSTLVSGNIPGGTFTSGNGTITGNNLDVSEDGIFNITYTVADSDPTTCLTGTASETFTITVGGEANAGADNSLEVCNPDVRNLNTAGVRNLYLGLLDEGVSTDGTFNPTINEIIAQYNTVSNFGDFTTTYTVGNGECQDSAVLTVTVIEANDAGDDVNIALCATGEAVDLFDYLSPLATLNGTFEGFEDGVFDPADAELGDTVITYEVPEDDSVCSTDNFTATFTITVSEPVAANAGDDVTIEYCSELNEEIALNSLLSEGAIVGGTFSAPFANGTFNPSVNGEGEYVVTYTLNGEACTTGTDSSTITITVVGATEAPVADAEQTFCFVDEPTVGDIVVTGDGVVIYEDAELTTPAEDTDPLVNGVSYFASFSESAACASGVTMITVTIQDSDAPTLVIDGDEFCRSDNPTVQELIENLNGTGIQIYTAVTGGTALATTTALEDGVTYFASGTDTEGACESSERLAVQVEVDFCGIPEGFSPNGDNKNDEFVIPDIATDYPNYELEVYNRWGSLVFEGNSSTGDWDGTSNQSATLGDGVLPTGFYFYVLNYNDGQTEPVQGKVYLSR